MNKLREKLNRKESLMGMHVFLGSKEIVEILGGLDYDYLFICAEHTLYDPEKICDMVKECEYSGTPALVRLPENDKTFTKKILDNGVSAVLFPMIKSAAQANEVMNWCVYPPNGERGFGPMKAVRWGLDSDKEYLAENLNGTVRMIQIEDIQAVNELEEIVKNPYIDGYIFGPNDLAASMGHIGDMYHEDVQNAIRKAVKILKDNGKQFGVAIVATDRDKIEYWKNMGMSMFSVSADWKLLLDGARKVHNDLKDIIKK